MSISSACSLRYPQSKFSALDSEGEEDGEDLTKKEPSKQGKEKAKRAEQVCLVWRLRGLVLLCAHGVGRLL